MCYRLYLLGIMDSLTALKYWGSLAGIEKICQEKVKKELVPTCQELVSCLLNELGEFVKRIMGCSLDHHLKPSVGKLHY